MSDQTNPTNEAELDTAETTVYKHFDEARQEAIDALKELLAAPTGIERGVLIDDLFGLLRVIIWPAPGTDESALRAQVDNALRDAGQNFWTGAIWICNASTGEADRIVYDSAWDEGVELTPQLRLDDRHRNRTAWFTRFRLPPWSTRGHKFGERTGPPIVVFWSFKGGVGRTTALAAFAIQRARLGERVAIIDFDLDAPGVGTLLAADEQGTIAPWGVVDYMLEQPHGQVPLKDYMHRCARDAVTREGSIWVVPAGRLDPTYLTKLSRVDLEVASPDQQHPLGALLEQLCPVLRQQSEGSADSQSASELNPDWILIDARAGLSPAAGLLLSGFAHLYVLFSTTNEQSFLGLERVVHHLGAERLRYNFQADCLLVHAMVPDNTVTAKEARSHFNERAEKIFREHYLVTEGSDPEDRLWSVRDIDNTQSPHASIPISYRDAFAFFRRVDDVADLLTEEAPYRELGTRIMNRFPKNVSAEEAED